MTSKTIDDVGKFISYLDRVRQMGYAEDNEEFALGIGCLAAPVFNHELRCVAAIGVTGGSRIIAANQERPWLRCCSAPLIQFHKSWEGRKTADCVFPWEKAPLRQLCPAI